MIVFIQLHFHSPRALFFQNEIQRKSFSLLRSELEGLEFQTGSGRDISNSSKTEKYGYVILKGPQSNALEQSRGTFRMLCASRRERRVVHANSFVVLNAGNIGLQFSSFRRTMWVVHIFWNCVLVLFLLLFIGASFSLLNLIPRIMKNSILELANFVCIFINV